MRPALTFIWGLILFIATSSCIYDLIVGKTEMWFYWMSTGVFLILVFVTSIEYMVDAITEYKNNKFMKEASSTYYD